MKKLLLVAAAVGLAAACTSDRYQGGGDYDYSKTPEPRPDNSGIQTNGPGMHSETRTGMPGPGTTGVPSQWDGGDRP